MAAPPPGFAIIAHRGDSDAAPENTFAAFDLALSRGFPAFETDAQLSADGAAVLLHCEELGRTCDGAGDVAGTSLDALKQLDAGSWFSPQFAGERIPTLEEALVRYKGRAHIHLELKTAQPALPAVVAGLVLRHGWACGGAASGGAGATDEEQAAAGAARAGVHGAAELAEVPGITLTSFHLEQLVRSKELLPAVRHAWLIQEWGPGLADEARSAGVEVICPRANALSKVAVDEIKAAGFGVRAWGVKDERLLLHAVACGVDGATVNWPSKAAQLLEQQREH